MLYKNNVPFDINAKENASEKKKVTDYLGGKFPGVIKFPPHLYKKSNSPKNKKADRPEMVPIPMKAVIFDGQSTEWVYAESARKDGDGNMIYNPPIFILKERASIGQNKIDLLYFLICISPLRVGSKNPSPGTRPLFVVENREAEAKSVIDLRLIKSEVEYLILHKIPKSELQVIASAMNIPNAHLLGENELKQKMLAHLEKFGTVEKYTEFKKLTNMDEVVRTMAVCQKAVDLQIIGFDRVGQVWYNRNEKSKRADNFCHMVSGMDDRQSLLHRVKNDVNLLNALEQGIAAAEERIAKENQAVGIKENE